MAKIEKEILDTGSAEDQIGLNIITEDSETRKLLTNTTQVISWSGSAELEAKLQVGDELYVRYTI